jgi:LuxR family maltose regulon positive regulatory protein
MSAVTRSAKFSPPRIHGLVERERVYAFLDEASARPVTWIAAPPGSGKTALVAGYLAKRKANAMWLQIDAEDDDPAVFFANLALLLQQRRKKIALPSYGPEYGADLERFAALFARSALPALTSDTVLVFDNFQDAPGTAFLTLVRAVLSVWCDAMRIVVVSRAEAPAPFAQLRARRAISSVLASDLAFDRQETAALMGSATAGDEIIASVQRMTGGWAAGIVLASEYLQRHGDADRALKSATRDAFLGYFAPEVLAAMPESDRASLYRAAHFTRFTPALVEKLDGRPGAGALFEDLHRRHLFTDLCDSDGPVYAFHALFREFLLAQAEQEWPSAKLTALRLEVAAHLERERDTSGAVYWYKRHQRWDDALRAIAAEQEVARGATRHATLVEWISGMPEDIVARHAELAYGVGEALLQLSRPTDAARWLERSAARYEADGEAGHQALALSRLIEALYLEGLDYRRIEDALARIRPLLDAAASLPPRESILVLRVALTMVRLDILQPAEGWHYAAALARLVEHCDDPNVRVVASAALLRHHTASDGERGAEQPYLNMSDAVRASEVTPLNRIDWFGIAGFVRCWRVDDPELGAKLLAEAEELSELYGLQKTGAYLRMMHDRVEGLALNGDIGELERSLLKLRDITPPESRHNWAIYYYHEGCYQLRRKNFRASVDTMRHAVKLARETRMPRLERLTLEARVSFGLMGLGEFDEAARMCEDMLVELEGKHSMRAAHVTLRMDGCHLLKALRAGEADLGPRLAKFFQDANRSSKTVFWLFNPELVAELANAALRHGVERDFVLELIRIRKLPAPPDAVRDWPWPLSVECFGGLRIHLKGELLQLGGKPPAKPLALLKLLAAESGEPVQSSRLRAALWPEGEDDRASFDMALGRLKKLLDAGDALSLDAGNVVLSTSDSWLDTRTFARVVRGVDILSRAANANWDPGEAERLMRELLDLYRGPLLPDENELPWILSAREQFQQRFLRAVDLLGAAMEAHGQHDKAIGLYERAVEIEPLAEGIYRRLMRCYQLSGSPADAIRVYRRCRQMLSVMLGMQPSKDTENLMRSIYDAQP